MKFLLLLLIGFSFGDLIGFNRMSNTVRKHRGPRFRHYGKINEQKIEHSIQVLKLYLSLISRGRQKY